jgi:hypothetical protein
MLAPLTTRLERVESFESGLLTVKTPALEVVVAVVPFFVLVMTTV